MRDPLDFQVIEFLEKKSGKTIKPFYGHKRGYHCAHINELYNQKSWCRCLTAALKETTPSAIKTYEAGKLGEVIREAPIAQIVSAVLEQAMRIRGHPHRTANWRDTGAIPCRWILQERLALPQRAPRRSRLEDQNTRRFENRRKADPTGWPALTLKWEIMKSISVSRPFPPFTEKSRHAASQEIRRDSHDAGIGPARFIAQKFRDKYIPAAWHQSRHRTHGFRENDDPLCGTCET